MNLYLCSVSDVDVEFCYNLCYTKYNFQTMINELNLYINCVLADLHMVDKERMGA